MFQTTRATNLPRNHCTVSKLQAPGRSAASCPHHSVHLASPSAYGPCPQHRICAVPQVSSEALLSPAQITREATYMDNLSCQQGQHVTVPNTKIVSSGEKYLPTCLDSFKGSFFFIRSLPLSASLSELPASLLWPFSLGSADTQFSDSLGFLPGCLSHFSFRS